MTLDQIAEQWAKVKTQAERFCFVSADPFLQRKSLLEVQAEAKLLGEYLEIAIADSEQPDSVPDTLYCLMEVLWGIQAELKMWIAISEKNFSMAWDYLVTAQNFFAFAAQHCPMITKADNRGRMLEALERILFPPQTFTSPGMLARFTCSICGRDSDACSHIRGRLYRGRLCQSIVSDIQLLEISLVDVPADKHRRFISYGDGVQKIDTLTNGPYKENGHGRAATPPATSLGRNSRCPCGSGRKFKNCCMKQI